MYLHSFGGSEIYFLGNMWLNKWQLIHLIFHPSRQSFPKEDVLKPVQLQLAEGRSWSHLTTVQVSVLVWWSSMCHCCKKPRGWMLQEPTLSFIPVTPTSHGGIGESPSSRGEDAVHGWREEKKPNTQRQNTKPTNQKPNKKNHNRKFKEWLADVL